MTSAVKSLRPRIWTGLRIALTLALLAALWQAVDGAEIAAALSTAAPVWIGAAVALLLAQTALSAQRWRVTARALGQDINAGYALREYFLSQAVNQTVPGAVMGDAARAVRARGGEGLLVAAQAVVFERLAGQIAMFVTFATAFLATDAVAGGLDWPPAFRGTLYLCLAAGATVFLFAILGGGLRLAPWLGPLGRALLGRDVVAVQAVLGVVITVCNLAAVACAARAVGVELSFVETVALVPVMLFAMLIPVTISGWGLREGAAAFILPIAGASAAEAVAASIVFGVALILSVLPGAIAALKS